MIKNNKDNQPKQEPPPSTTPTTQTSTTNSSILGNPPGQTNPFGQGLSGLGDLPTVYTNIVPAQVDEIARCISWSKLLRGTLFKPRRRQLVLLFI